VIQSIKTFARLVSDKLWLRMVLGIGFALAIVACLLGYSWLYPNVPSPYQDDQEGGPVDRPGAVLQMLRRGDQ
jgi:hypothetical protein